MLKDVTMYSALPHPDAPIGSRAMTEDSVDLSAHSEAAAPTDTREAISKDDLRALQRKSDLRGAIQLVGHVAAMGASGWALWAYWQTDWRIAVPALVVYGFTLVTMFGALHENVHRTAFRTIWANDAVAWFAGLCSFYNSSFYRHFHGWHHRFTQDPVKDPELEGGKPTGWGSYLVEMSGVPWWIGKVKTYAVICCGRMGRFPYVPAKARGEVVRSVRLQMLAYAAVIALSFVLRQPLFLVLWLVPVAVAQPLLRGLTMAEHTGCSENDDPLTNTRTTHTWFPVRFLMWNMPYHAEHHRYPALPFHALAAAHERMKPVLAHVATGGYLAAHWSIIRGFRRSPT